MDSSFAAGAIGLTIAMSLLCVVLSVGFAVLIVFVVRRVADSAEGGAERRRLLVQGRPGQGKIVQIGTGSMVITRGVRRSVQMTIGLEIATEAAVGHRGPLPAPYPVQLQMMVPEIAMAGLQPGAVVPVRIDPANAQHVVIDLAAMGYQV